MNRENLAKSILDNLKLQLGGYLHEDGLQSVSTFAPIDLIQLAGSLMDFLHLKDEQPLRIKGVESCAKTPIVRIVWGDGVVTYAHFTQEAEVVHMMGRETVPKRFGTLTPEEALAS